MESEQGLVAAAMRAVQDMVRNHGFPALVVGAAMLSLAAERLLAGHWDLAREIELFAVLLVLGRVATYRPYFRRYPEGMPLSPLVAIVGCDGSGKSTLASDLVRTFGDERPMSLAYLGLGSGAMGERIKRVPLIGPAIERRLAKKAKKTRTKGERIPGLPTALVVYAFSLMRMRRFCRMLEMRRTGTLVVTDRYPQIDVAGFYDGPGLSAAGTDNRLIGWLARRERRMYAWMAGFLPDLVIRLNVDVETAYARKPDHKLDSLRAKVAVTPTLRFNDAHIVDLDSRAPYPKVRAEALSMVGDIVARSDVPPSHRNLPPVHSGTRSFAG